MAIRTSDQSNEAIAVGLKQAKSITKIAEAHKIIMRTPRANENFLSEKTGYFDAKTSAEIEKDQRKITG
eukprot:scaffold43608_cov55-Attheya_sp.AAC.2